MKKSPVFFFIILAFGCNQPDTSSMAAKDTTIVVTADTIPETRTAIRREAVADYTEKVADSLNDWKFSVSLYETKKTFQYLLRVQYKELRITDSLLIPNFGTLPKVGIHKGKEPLSCILGFFDRKEQFKEYKLVRVTNDRLKISTINYYSVGRYHNKAP